MWFVFGVQSSATVTSVSGFGAESVAVPADAAAVEAASSSEEPHAASATGASSNATSSASRRGSLELIFTVNL